MIEINRKDYLDLLRPIAGLAGVNINRVLWINFDPHHIEVAVPGWTETDDGIIPDDKAELVRVVTIDITKDQETEK